MIYPVNFEAKIGFDRIRQLVHEACAGPLGQALTDDLQFSADFDTLRRWLGQTEEFRQILAEQADFPTEHFMDVGTTLRQAEIENSVLDASQFFALRQSLGTIAACLRFFDQRDPSTYPHLRALTAGVSVDRTLLKRIDFTIDDRGQVRDTASSELQRLRTAILSEQHQLRKRMETMLRSAIRDGYTPEDMQVTVRNGRLVIPVLAEHKRHLKGLIHDESATGQTAFIEPTVAFEANNRLRELELEERREVLFILRQLTDHLRPYVAGLRQAYQFLGQMDFIRAKARIALRLGAVLPHMENRCVARWHQAYHPLLWLNLQAQQRTAVPLHIELDDDQRIVLISGPNAGGKSVCLKTVGLLQYMWQCGLLVPVREDSTMGVFRHIFVDIGDEQSLENDLSTYSSHLTNMRQFLQLSDRRTLLLVDEFGAGTEPQYGGAIAEAILEALNRQRVFGVVTTHYTNLKVYAENTAGIVNGAMRFDAARMEPLYQLDIGKPGSSFALEIARKIGLPKDVLAQAQVNLGEERVQFDKLLRELEIEKEVYHQRNVEMATRERELKKTAREYQELRDFLENNRKATLNDAKVAAKELLREANQRVEQTIREIRESQADKERTREVRQSLDDFRTQLQPEPVVAAKPAARPADPDEEADLGQPLKAGDYVRIRDNGALAEVVSLKGREAEVLIGVLKSKVKVNRLEKVSRRVFRAQQPEADVPPVRTGVDVTRKQQQFSFNLDVRGKRGEEALAEVGARLDDALLVGAPELRIVHGKGDGILRARIREYLRGYPQVRQLSDEHADRGGAGVTLVTLR